MLFLLLFFPFNLFILSIYEQCIGLACVCLPTFGEFAMMCRLEQLPRIWMCWRHSWGNLFKRVFEVCALGADFARHGLGVLQSGLRLQVSLVYLASIVGFPACSEGQVCFVQCGPWRQLSSLTSPPSPYEGKRDSLTLSVACKTQSIYSNRLGVLSCLGID